MEMKPRGILWALSYWLIPLAILVHLSLTPFNKVEESHSVQAVHDALHHGFDFGSYDFKEFPGVVPRTFIGAVGVAVLTWPLSKLNALAGLTKLADL